MVFHVQVKSLLSAFICLLVVTYVWMLSQWYLKEIKPALVICIWGIHPWEIIKQLLSIRIANIYCPEGICLAHDSCLVLVATVQCILIIMLVQATVAHTQLQNVQIEQLSNVCKHFLSQHIVHQSWTWSCCCAIQAQVFILSTIHCDVQCCTIWIFLVQVRLRTEMLWTPNLTWPRFELMTSRSWLTITMIMISCHWDDWSNHLAISDLKK